jgi:hypothetical protein
MRVMIEGYENRTGEHCGSIAMRNLLQHYCGLDLSEPMIFGVGAGVDLLLIEGHDFDPTVLLFGRSTSMEADVADALGVDYVERVELDDDRAWETARREVGEGRPTMLSGDIFYLDYREYKVHFPAHRFVLLGFDDDEQVVYVADRIDPEPQACSYGALRKSRNPRGFFSTYNLWGKFENTAVGRSLEEACARAIDRAARRMLGRADAERPALPDPAMRVSQGLAGLEAFAKQLEDWPDRDDCEGLASYTSQCLEKWGNGGGNFRNLYAAFLGEVREFAPTLVDAEAPLLASRASQQWTVLSSHLWELGKTRSADGLVGCRRALDQLQSLEAQLFERLAASVAASR